MILSPPSDLMTYPLREQYRSTSPHLTRDCPIGPQFKLGREIPLESLPQTKCWPILALPVSNPGATCHVPANGRFQTVRQEGVWHAFSSQRFPVALSAEAQWCDPP